MGNVRGENAIERLTCHEQVRRVTAPPPQMRRGRWYYTLPGGLLSAIEPALDAHKLDREQFELDRRLAAEAGDCDRVGFFENRTVRHELLNIKPLAELAVPDQATLDFFARELSKHPRAV